MTTQVIDPVTGVPRPPQGNGALAVTAHAADAAIITPDDGVYYEPPLQVWVGAAGNVAIVPHGRKGDKSVIYPMLAGRIVPVLARQVLQLGTTSTLLIGQQVYKPAAILGPTADSTSVTADSTTITADHR